MMTSPKPDQWSVEVVRQKAPTCRADIDDGNGYVYIRERTAWRVPLKNYAAFLAALRTGKFDTPMDYGDKQRDVPPRPSGITLKRREDAPHS
jgi:hypothetical protein